MHSGAALRWSSESRVSTWQCHRALQQSPTWKAPVPVLSAQLSVLLHSNFQRTASAGSALLHTTTCLSLSPCTACSLTLPSLLHASVSHVPKAPSDTAIVACRGGPKQLACRVRLTSQPRPALGQSLGAGRFLAGAGRFPATLRVGVQGCLQAINLGLLHWVSTCLFLTSTRLSRAGSKGVSTSE